MREGGRSERLNKKQWCPIYLVVLLAEDQLFPRSYQHVQRKSEEQAIIILRERVLSSARLRSQPAKNLRFSASHLVAIHQTFPSFDESLPRHVLILSSRVGIIIEDIRHVLVHVGQERAEFRPQQLIEQLLDAYT